MKKWSSPLIINEMLIRTTQMLPHTSENSLHQTGNSEYWPELGRKELTFEKLKIELPFYPVSPFFGIYQRTQNHEFEVMDTHLCSFALLVTIAKSWRELRCQPHINWIRRL